MISRVVAALALLSIAAACATAASNTVEVAAPTAPALVDVDVGLLPDEAGRVGGVSLRYCPRGAWPRRLAPENRRALPYLVSAVDDGGRALAVDADGVRTKGLAGCARLVVDVGRLADALGDRDLALRAGDDLIVTPDLWLWRPEPTDDAARLFVKLDAAPFDALVPWTAREEANGRYVVTPATFALKSDAAFGRFETEDVDAAGTRFVVARLDDGRAPPQLAAWLQASASAAASVLGRYPFAHVNVLVVPTHVTRPIVVGFFSRGGGPTATFFVGEGAADIDDADLDATGRWALTHELSHPLLPPVRLQDAWLNEGLATWHQDLLARRTGMLKDDEAYWRELLRGLATGAARAASDRMSLADASAHMHETGAYQHAYWAGVGVMLLAEVEAQKEGASLDDLVRALRERYPLDERPHAALDLLAEVANAHAGGPAAHAGGPAVVDKGAVAAAALLRVWQAQKERPFPATDDVLKALGVAVDAVGGVHLDDTAPLAAVRKSITTSVPLS